MERIEAVKRECDPAVIAKQDLTERVVEGIEVAGPWRVSEVLKEPERLGEAGDERSARARVDPVHQIAKRGELVHGRVEQRWSAEQRGCAVPHELEVEALKVCFAEHCH